MAELSRSLQQLQQLQAWPRSSPNPMTLALTLALTRTLALTLTLTPPPTLAGEAAIPLASLGQRRTDHPEGTAATAGGVSAGTYVPSYLLTTYPYPSPTPAPTPTPTPTLTLPLTPPLALPLTLARRYSR